MQIINVETKEQLKELIDASAMTWEGLAEEDYSKALDCCSAEGEDGTGYVIKGKVMNDLCKLTGTNAYPDNLNIFCIKEFVGLAVSWGARWLDDVYHNNADRQGVSPLM